MKSLLETLFRNACTFLVWCIKTEYPDKCLEYWKKFPVSFSGKPPHWVRMTEDWDGGTVLSPQTPSPPGDPSLLLTAMYFVSTPGKPPRSVRMKESTYVTHSLGRCEPSWVHSPICWRSMRNSGRKNCHQRLRCYSSKLRWIGGKSCRSSPLECSMILQIVQCLEQYVYPNTFFLLQLGFDIM